MKKIVMMFWVLCLFVSTHLWSQGKELDFSKPASRYKGIYLTALYSKITEFPLSYTDDLRERVAFSESSSPVFSMGYAYAGFWKMGYIAGELEFHSPKFSDERITDRRIPTWNLLLDLGIVLPLPYVPIVLYGTIGLGWMHQTDYEEDWLGEGFYENLEKNIIPEIFGMGIKISPIRNLILEAELKFLREPYAVYSEGTHYLPAGSSPASHGSDPMGQRFAFGITYIFGSKADKKAKSID